MHEMVADRPDWCISRQRFWGVPLIVFYCESCGKQLRDFKALRHVLPFFEREGSDTWYTHSAEELLPPGTKCSCGAAKWQKESDILDVWFESGSTHLAVLSEQNGLHWPAEVYLEGPDQFRGWFQSSLLNAIGTRGHAPYRQVVTHGWTLDEKGAPMSKSRGNALYPKEICEKWGADLLRLWVVSQDYTADMRNSPAMMTQLVGSLSQNSQYVPLRALESFRLRPCDEMWSTTRTCGKSTPGCFAAPERSSASASIGTKIMNFIASIMRCTIFAAWTSARSISTSSRIASTPSRRIIAAAAPRKRPFTISPARSSALIAPVLVFTSEEVWKHLPQPASAAPSVHMANFPAAEHFENAFDDARAKNWDRLLAVREEVLKALEPLRAAKTISANLEARVTLAATGDLAGLLQKYAAQLPAFFIVSQVEIASGEIEGASPAPGIEGLRIRAERAHGKKCERCWNYSDACRRERRVSHALRALPRGHRRNRARPRPWSRRRNVVSASS